MNCCKLKYLFFAINTVFANGEKELNYCKMPRNPSVGGPLSNEMKFLIGFYIEFRFVSFEMLTDKLGVLLAQSAVLL
jgi:hypothetical protein